MIFWSFSRWIASYCEAVQSDGIKTSSQNICPITIILLIVRSFSPSTYFSSQLHATEQDLSTETSSLAEEHGYLEPVLKKVISISKQVRIGWIIMATWASCPQWNWQASQRDHCPITKNTAYYIWRHVLERVSTFYIAREVQNCSASWKSDRWTCVLLIRSFERNDTTV